MRRETVLALVLALTGLSAMAWTVENVRPQSVEVDEIGPGMTGEVVRVDGNVSLVERSSGHLFFQIEDSTGSIDGVVFDTERSEIREPAVFEGEVAIYRGEMEVIVDEIEERSENGSS